MPTTIRDYANERAVSYEAVRKQLKQYENELKGLTYKKGRTTFLTEEAITFLDEHRQERAVVLEAGDSERIKQLEEANKKLMEQLLFAQEQIIQAKNEHIQLVTQINENKLMLEQKANELSRELDTFQKVGFFGLYKKIKK